MLLIDAGLDAMNVDVKGDASAVKKFCKTVDVEKVWGACTLARARGVHVEITTLDIPTVNDSDATIQGIAERLCRDLGRDVPWHLSSYCPAYRFTSPPTPIQTLERAWMIGKDAGLHFVYVGNVPGHPHDNTYLSDLRHTLDPSHRVRSNPNSTSCWPVSTLSTANPGRMADSITRQQCLVHQDQQKVVRHIG